MENGEALFREVVKRLEGAYVVAGLELPIPGDWQVIIDRFVSAVQAQAHLARLASERYEQVLQLERKLAERADNKALLDENNELKRELRQERGLKALLANGMPPTGNGAFDKILATHPVAAMIQRGWLPGITGFDDLPALESAICHFWGVRTIEEAVNPKWDTSRAAMEHSEPQ